MCVPPPPGGSPLVLNKGPFEIDFLNLAYSAGDPDQDCAHARHTPPLSCFSSPDLLTKEANY